MQHVTAKTKYVRIPPRKARLAADLVRGLPVEAAYVQLRFCQLKAGRLLWKTLHSAVANAESRFDVERKELRVKEIRVDPGPVIKRAKSKNRGGRVPIMKRTSHFTIVVGVDH
jgi:large subunit ribosomal protein L22